MSRYKPGTPDTYIAVHETLKRTRGSARTHICSCGRPAREWAYQFTGSPELRDSEGKRPHSINPDDYAAMCRSCHVRFDWENDPVFAEKMATTLAQNSRALSDRVKTDPVLRAEMVERGRNLGMRRAERMAADPEFAEDMAEAGRRGAAAQVERMRLDPAYAEPILEVRRANMRKRRRCSGCGFVSHPAGIGNHQKSTGHTGWEETS